MFGNLDRRVFSLFESVYVIRVFLYKICVMILSVKGLVLNILGFAICSRITWAAQTCGSDASTYQTKAHISSDTNLMTYTYCK